MRLGPTAVRLLVGGANVAIGAIILALLVTCVAIYLAIFPIALTIAIVCWFLSDVIIRGNEKYGLRLLDVPFEWIGDYIVCPVAAVVIPIIVMPKFLWDELAKRARESQQKGNDGGSGTTKAAA